jgi:hypothetical protein
METVLKTVLVLMASVGSNPTPSATGISNGFLVIFQRAPNPGLLSFRFAAWYNKGE